MNAADKRESYYVAVAASLGGAFVLLYFLFPPIFVLPVLVVFGPYDKAPPRVQAVVHTFFLPVRYLSEKFPAYRGLISKESDLTGIH